MTNPPIKIGYAPEFKRSMKRLRKKYPHVQEDIQPLINQLSMGETPGDQIPGVNHTAYKVRVKNTDNPKGKSSGYRVVYYIKTSTHINLVTIYSKTSQEDIGAEQVRNIIKRLDDAPKED